jgi:hypothetical protein
MINTYDNKDKSTYNVKDLGDCMREYINYQQQQKREAIAKAESYYDGYQTAIREIANIMSASNYRVEEDEA